MKFLVIEDSDLKFQLVQNLLKDHYPNSIVHRSASYQSGVETLMRESYDLVVLDMTLPDSDIQHSFVGVDDFPFGGELILREMTRKKINTRFIVLTQYDTFVLNHEELTIDQLRVKLMQKYSHFLLGCIKLDYSGVEWKSELIGFIES
jgi:CheY-like chemotaxis protein